MIEIGKYNELTINRRTVPGLFLTDDEGNDVLLPNKYIPNEFEIGEKINVFVYLDFDERLIATTITPKITLHEFAPLKVVDVNHFGAFMDWGLEKDLFVPFKEQNYKMEVKKTYVVYLYEDKNTGRLVASERVNKWLSNETLSVNEGDKVKIIINKKTDLGYSAIINQKHIGLIYHDEIFEPLHLGDIKWAFIKKIREDNKIDLSLNQIGYIKTEPNAEKILTLLHANNGFINLHDKSDPEEIKERLNMSKKAFKQSLGLLYKNKQIELLENGVKLIS